MNVYFTKKYSYFKCKSLVTSNHWSNVLFFLFIKCNMCKGKLRDLWNSFFSAFGVKVRLAWNLTVENYHLPFYLKFGKIYFYKSFISKSNFKKEKKDFKLEYVPGIFYLMFFVWCVDISQDILLQIKKNMVPFPISSSQIVFHLKGVQYFFPVIVVHYSYVVIFVLFIYFLFWSVYLFIVLICVFL